MSIFVLTVCILNFWVARLGDLKDWRRGEGFEPPMRPCDRITALASRCLKPLSHLSEQYERRVSQPVTLATILLVTEPQYVNVPPRYAGVI